LNKIEDNPIHWKKTDLRNFEANINRIAWSLDGESLGVSTNDGISYLFKEDSENEWNLISETNTEGVIENNDN
jgi:hypothetical protein